MFAQLGPLTFRLITYFNGLDENNSYNFVQHERIENKPTLQFLGENLQELNLKMSFHSSFCLPELELKLLKELAKKGKPLKFIKGNGDYIGVFVIQSIGTITEQTSKIGSLTSIQVDIKLLEFAGEVKEEKQTSGGLRKR